MTSTNFDTEGTPSHDTPAGDLHPEEKTHTKGNADPLFESERTAVPDSPANAHKSALSPLDSQRCMHLMTHLIDYFSPLLFTAPATRHMACTDVFADTWMKLVIQPAIDDEGVYKPLETLERIKRVDWAEVGLCSVCVSEKNEEWTEEQQEVWRLMDQWLGL